MGDLWEEVLSWPRCQQELPAEDHGGCQPSDVDYLDSAEDGGGCGCPAGVPGAGPAASAQMAKKRQAPGETQNTARKAPREAKYALEALSPEKLDGKCTCVFVELAPGSKIGSLPIPLWPQYELTWHGRLRPQHTWITWAYAEHWLVRIVETVTKRSVREVAKRSLERFRRGLNAPDRCGGSWQGSDGEGPIGGGRIRIPVGDGSVSGSH